MNDLLTIVDWDEVARADRSLEEWLASRGVERADVDDDLRCDISRSFDGVRRHRWSIRRSRWPDLATPR